MTNKPQTIEELRTQLDKWTDITGCVNISRKTMEQIIQSLQDEKAEMTTPVKIDKDEKWCMWYRCSECKDMEIAEDYHYCPNCGRKVDWSPKSTE